MILSYSVENLKFFIDQLGVDLNDYKKKKKFNDEIIESEILISCLSDFGSPDSDIVYKFNAKQRITMTHIKTPGDYTQYISYLDNTVLYTSYFPFSGKLFEFWYVDGEYNISADYTRDSDLPYSIMRGDGGSELFAGAEEPSSYYLTINDPDDEVSFRQYVNYQLQRVTIICDALTTECEEIITLILQYCG
jgi:hypothetical protein